MLFGQTQAAWTVYDGLRQTVRSSTSLYELAQSRRPPKMFEYQIPYGGLDIVAWSDPNIKMTVYDPRTGINSSSDVKLFIKS